MAFRRDASSATKGAPAGGSGAVCSGSGVMTASFTPSGGRCRGAADHAFTGRGSIFRRAAAVSPGAAVNTGEPRLEAGHTPERLTQDVEVVARIAERALRHRGEGPTRRMSRVPKLRLPLVWVMTDPGRRSAASVCLTALPRAAGVIVRHFGLADERDAGLKLAASAEARDIPVLLTPERNASDRGLQGAAPPSMHAPRWAQGRVRRSRPKGLNSLVTFSAHSLRDLQRAAMAGADAALLSPVFPSASPSAGRPIGPVRLRLLLRAAPPGLAIYALGGITPQTARRLAGAALAGFAGVSFHEQKTAARTRSGRRRRG